MNQRAMIAMALAGRPQLLIADEPTTALDVTIQAQILELMRELRSGKDMAVILITHDLGVIAELTDRVAVMYAGCIVELASVHDIFHSPKHPYTHGLLGSLPRVDRNQEVLVPIEGTVPALHELPAGCHFAPRCQHAVDLCREAKPPMAAGEAATPWPVSTRRDDAVTMERTDPTAAEEPVLEVRDLVRHFRGRRRGLRGQERSFAPWTASASPCIKGRRSALSARAGAASRRSGR